MQNITNKQPKIIPRMRLQHIYLYSIYVSPCILLVLFESLKNKIENKNQIKIKNTVLISRTISSRFKYLIEKIVLDAIPNIV